MKCWFFAKMTIIWPRTPGFWPGQSSLGSPILVRWWQAMTHWNCDTKGSFVFGYLTGERDKYKIKYLLRVNMQYRGMMRCGKQRREWWPFIFFFWSCFTTWTLIFPADNNKNKGESTWQWRQGGGAVVVALIEGVLHMAMAVTGSMARITITMQQW